MSMPSSRPKPVVAGVRRIIGQRIDLNGRNEVFEGYTVALSGRGAAGIRLHIDNCYLPGFEMYMYPALDANPNNLFGPYTCEERSTELYTHTVFSSEVFLQLRRASSETTEGHFGFNIVDVAYLAPSYHPERRRRFLAEGSSLCNNVECIFAAGSPTSSCVGGQEGVSSPVYDAHRYAVGYMLWPCSGGSDPWVCSCSGTLVNDAVNSGTLYFMTANHCLKQSKWAAGLEVLFQYWIDGCGDGTCASWSQVQANHPQSLRTLGADLLATGRAGDFTLLQLAGPEPADISLLGWDLTPIAESYGATIHTVSHPRDSPQAYDQSVVSDFSNTCMGSRDSWIYTQQVIGTSDGGSSGSAAVNDAGLFVGQMYGGCGWDGTNTCAFEEYATVYGALSGYFPAVSEWLDPAPACIPTPEVCGNNQDDDCDTLVDCDDQDCASDEVCLTSCIPVAEVCDNNFDDDCDSLLDCSDSDCSSSPACTSPPGCGTKGNRETCQQDTDCSSCDCSCNKRGCKCKGD